MHNHKT